MDTEQPSRTSSGTRTLTVGAIVVLALGAGWFALSHLVMGTTTSDALGESLGVMFALLVVASIVGAFVSARKTHGPQNPR